MNLEGRFTDDDRIADRFDARYTHYSYDGVRETLFNFLGPKPSSVLEVGCGTGHWLAAIASARGIAGGGIHGLRGLHGCQTAGVDPAAPMLARARSAAPSARLVRARA